MAGTPPPGRPPLDGRSIVAFAIIGDEWVDEAVCAQTDPDSYFPEKGGSPKEAKRVCMRCPVREQCLDYALAHDERFGVWGGKSERERRRIKRGETV